MKFVLAPGDITATEARSHGRVLAVHPDESSPDNSAYVPDLSGVSILTENSTVLATVWLDRSALLAWAKEIITAYDPAD